MTVSAPGGPDFAGPIPWRSNNLLPSFLGTYPAGHTTTPVLPTSTYASLAYRITPNAGAAVVTVSWWGDALGTQGLGQDMWGVTGARFLLVYLPTSAPFFSIDVNNNSGGGAFTAGNYAFLTNVPVTRPTYPVHGQIAAGQGVSVPAAGTVTDKLLFYTKGAGHLNVIPGDALGKLHYQIRVIDNLANVLAVLYDNAAPAAPFDFAFPFPDALVQLNINNTDAGAAHTTGYSMWCSEDV